MNKYVKSYNSNKTDYYLFHSLSSFIIPLVSLVVLNEWMLLPKLVSENFLSPNFLSAMVEK